MFLVEKYLANPVVISLNKNIDKSTKAMSEICLTLTMKTQE